MSLCHEVKKIKNKILGFIYSIDKLYGLLNESWKNFPLNRLGGKISLYIYIYIYIYILGYSLDLITILVLNLLSFVSKWSSTFQMG